MTDIEGSSQQQQQQRPNVNNPYGQGGQAIGMLPRNHPLNYLKRILYMTVSVYGMIHFDVYQTILHSSKVRHEWFKIGLATSIAMLFVKGYVELYIGKVQKKEVSYKTIPQLTHTVMILMLLSSIAFHTALWPVYKAKAMLIMFLLSCFILNFCLVFPTTVQNIVAFGLLTFFLQEYK